MAFSWSLIIWFCFATVAEEATAPFSAYWGFCSWVFCLSALYYAVIFASSSFFSPSCYWRAILYLSRLKQSFFFMWYFCSKMKRFWLFSSEKSRLTLIGSWLAAYWLLIPGGTTPSGTLEGCWVAWDWLNDESNVGGFWFWIVWDCCCWSRFYSCYYNWIACNCWTCGFYNMFKAFNWLNC